MDTRSLIKKAGGPGVVGRVCGVSSQAVSQWRSVPLEYCAAIENACSGAVTCEQLRPDVTWLRTAKGRVTGYTVHVEIPRAA